MKGRMHVVLPLIVQRLFPQCQDHLLLCISRDLLFTKPLSFWPPDFKSVLLIRLHLDRLNGSIRSLWCHTKPRPIEVHLKHVKLYQWKPTQLRCLIKTYCENNLQNITQEFWQIHICLHRIVNKPTIHQEDNCKLIFTLGVRSLSASDLQSSDIINQITTKVLNTGL